MGRHWGGRLMQPRETFEIRWFDRGSDADAFEVKNPGSVAEETAAELDDPLGDGLEVSNLGLLEGRNQLSKPVVECFLLVSSQVV